MTNQTASRGGRRLAVALISLLALLSAGLVASPANAATAPCYPATACNPALQVTSPTTTSLGISASINNLVPNSTVVWTWTNGSQTFQQTSAVDSAGVALIVMPVGIAGTYTITAAGYTTDAKGAQVPVTRTGTAVVNAPSQPVLQSTQTYSGKSKAKWNVSAPAGVTCTGQFRYRIEFKKTSKWKRWQRYDWTYYTKGDSHTLTLSRKKSLGNGWYRAVVRGKCGVPGFITSPVYLKK